jgi:hypothetical protein
VLVLGALDPSKSGLMNKHIVKHIVRCAGNEDLANGTSRIQHQNDARFATRELHHPSFQRRGVAFLSLPPVILALGQVWGLIRMMV